MKLSTLLRWSSDTMFRNLLMPIRKRRFWLDLLAIGFFALLALTSLRLFMTNRNSIPIGFDTSSLKTADWGERANLARKLYKVLQRVENPKSSWMGFNLESKEKAAERLALSLFPFIQNPSQASNPAPVRSLRSTFTPESKGIIIPTGRDQIFFTKTLIMAFRDIHNVTIPISIAFGGGKDLTIQQQQELQSLRPGIELLDVTEVLSDAFMDLENGKYAIKPLAALGCRFEQVILVDADAVFAQSPEVLWSHPGYRKTGLLFFHDRKVGPHPGNPRQLFFEEKTQNIKLLDTCCDNIRHGYLQEQDSGIVLIDKRRTDVLIGLMHTCWQNVPPARDLSYEVFNGDKETFWLGMAMTGVPYAFNQPEFAGMVGVVQERGNETFVCGSTLSHYDAKGDLIWYNGSLLKNKGDDNSNYMVPQYHIKGGECQWGPFDEPLDLGFLVCCKDGAITKLATSESDVIQASIDIASKLQ